ncbi:hypothetical protein CBER1_02907 [Cercospora berteroae]|uniref:AAA+ ATPase domain-containing protein n=1 Tax=Cercospora berteroae TaxID=357750 RepID=A0A2S6BQK7_9PEZI|nr:hypothetical protein CBER1_02907 [Cercospora berteroae]
MDGQTNGIGDAGKGVQPSMVKELFGIPHERGGLTWLDECPEYLSKQHTRPRFGNYPGENIDAQDLEFKSPFHPFFHHWASLVSANDKAHQNHSEQAEQINALIEVLGDEFKDSIADAESLAKNGNTTFSLLWTLFPPGCPVFSEINGKTHCFLVDSYKYLMAEHPPTLAVHLLILDYDGSRYGWQKSARFIPAFSGSTKILALPVIPFHYYENAGPVLDTLYERGSVAVDLSRQAPAYRSYDGSVRLNKSGDYDFEDVEVFVNERLMIEPKVHSQQAIDNISPIRWNDNAFESLVVPPARKRLLEALIRQQKFHKQDFDDVVQGKGQGLIMLLSGPPGTGKTLTAESVADHLRVPLYAVSANELGDSAKDMEHQFPSVLRLAASWDAVLLLDEADAFLEKRAPQDTPGARERNKRVAAFLRILEYYRGILILTTNRAVNFDDAFYSRIHLSLPFKPLDHQFREDIWKNFLRGSEVSESEISEFAKEEINGRQIKNVVKMSRLLAQDNGGMPLQASHVRDVLSITREDVEGQ